MSKIFKRITAVAMAAVMLSGTVASAATYGNYQPTWAKRKDYKNAWGTIDTSFSVGTKNSRNFEGIMGIFAKSPHCEYTLETGTSANLVGSAQYSTSAYCVYVDSSGNEQSYNVKGDGKTRIDFNAVGPYQFFLRVSGVHQVTYDNETKRDSTLYF